MPNYEVCVVVDASVTVDIDADTPEEATELAEDQVLRKGYASLCHQCSRNLNMGDPIGAVVSDGTGELLDSTLAGTLRAEKVKLVKALKDVSGYCEGTWGADEIARVLKEVGAC